MGDYIPDQPALEAYLWSIEHGLKITPVAIYGQNRWRLEITDKGRVYRPETTYGPVEIWEALFDYYLRYYKKNHRSE